MAPNWASALAVVLALFLSLICPDRAMAKEAQIQPDIVDSERVLLAKLLDQVNILNEEIASLRAIGKLGKGEATVLELLAQLKELKSRASRLEVPMPDRSVAASYQPLPKGIVASVLVPERVVLISRGRDSGMLEGAVLRLGSDGVLAKVVESRSNVLAAAVEKSYKGKLADLVGCTAELSAR